MKSSGSSFWLIDGKASSPVLFSDSIIFKCSILFSLFNQFVTLRKLSFGGYNNFVHLKWQFYQRPFQIIFVSLLFILFYCRPYALDLIFVRYTTRWEEIYRTFTLRYFAHFEIFRIREISHPNKSNNLSSKINTYIPQVYIFVSITIIICEFF